MALDDVIIELLSAITEDAASPMPGFITLSTIARLLVQNGHMNARGMNGIPSRRQLLLVKKILDTAGSIEKLRTGRKTYYRYL